MVERVCLESKHGENVVTMVNEDCLGHELKQAGSSKLHIHLTSPQSETWVLDTASILVNIFSFSGLQKAHLQAKHSAPSVFYNSIPGSPKCSDQSFPHPQPHRIRLVLIRRLEKVRSELRPSEKEQPI